MRKGPFVSPSLLAMVTRRLRAEVGVDGNFSRLFQPLWYFSR